MTCLVGQDEEQGGAQSRIKPASLIERAASPKRVLDRWRSFVALDPSDGMLYAELFEDEDEEAERKARLSEPFTALPDLLPGFACSALWAQTSFFSQKLGCCCLHPIRVCHVRLTLLGCEDHGMRPFGLGRCEALRTASGSSC